MKRNIVIIVVALFFMLHTITALEPTIIPGGWKSSSEITELHEKLNGHYKSISFKNSTDNDVIVKIRPDSNDISEILYPETIIPSHHTGYFPIDEIIDKTRITVKFYVGDIQREMKMYGDFTSQEFGSLYDLRIRISNDKICLNDSSLDTLYNFQTSSYAINIPDIIITSVKKLKIEDNMYECPICMEIFPLNSKNWTIANLTCRHALCRQCKDNIQKTVPPTCPMCRKPMMSDSDMLK
jgi:hypothetical protein